MMWIESERQALSRLEAANEQARANEQHAGECYLSSDHQGLRSLPLRTIRSGTTAFILQRSVEIRLRKAQCW